MRTAVHYGSSSLIQISTVSSIAPQRFYSVLNVTIVFISRLPEMLKATNEKAKKKLGEKSQRIQP